jgi:parallel beta-helix repeat protein
MKRLTVFFVTFFIIIVLAVDGCVPSPTPTATPEMPTPTPAPPTATATRSTPALLPQGTNFPVWSTADSGLGSLRQALLDAHPYDTISFEPDVFKPDEPATIAVIGGLPQITQGYLTIDASNAGVILDGIELPRGTGIAGLEIVSDENVIRGLQVVNFPGTGIVVAGCYTNTIGGDRSIGSGPIGQGNLISSNGVFGIEMSNASNNVIKGNYIGTDPGGSQTWGNSNEGIYIEGGSENEISQNLICANGANGITLHGIGSHSNIVSGNLIGVGANQSWMGNGDSGVEIRHGAHDNEVSDNIIANISSYHSAIQIYGSDSIGNTISRNSIYDNRWVGIALWGGGNLELAPPIITDFDLSAGTIRGLAYPNALVEVFSIDNRKSVFVGQTYADPTGVFAFRQGAFTGPRLTASATDVRGNTSEFSLITDGAEGTTSLQLNNTGLPTHLETFMSNELEDDNHIGGYWHDLWDYYQPLSELVDQARYSGVKRFRFAIQPNEIIDDPDGFDEFILNADEFIEPADDLIQSLEENGIQQITYQMTLYKDISWRTNEKDTCLRFDRRRADYDEELDHYLRYVEYIVEHFGGRIQYYEIWNEPDNQVCYLGIDRDDYIALVEETVSVIRDLQRKYPEELQDIKIKLGGVSGLSNPYSQDYLFYLLESDEIMPLVDVISWHPFYGDSPEHDPDYIDYYPDLVQKIKDTASSHGFEGEYHAEEMNWRPWWDPDTDHFSEYSEITSTKYWIRGILTNLGLDVTAGNLQFMHYWGLASFAVHNLSTIMAGSEPTSLVVEIDSPAENTASYGFTLPNGDVLFALWTSNEATDYDPGVNKTLTFSNLSANKVVGIDVLHGFEQELEFTVMANGDLIIPDLMVKDYPIILRFIQ